MKILICDTYYPAFLAAFYRARPELAAASYDAQLQALIDACFGTSDYYSRHLKALGHQAFDVIPNNDHLQKAFAKEHPATGFAAWLRNLAGRAPGLEDILLAQTRALKPDVFYCQDIAYLTPAFIQKLRPHVGLMVGQIACPLPPDPYVCAYDLILTSFPHFVPRLRAKGLASEFFRIGFDERVLQALGDVQKDVVASFVGGISLQHGKALPTLEYLAEHAPMSFFGYGAEALPDSSPIKARHRGEVWGLDMYRALARSRIAFNRHIDVAENNANNMRLYEATGVGALLVTDRKDNLGDLFEIGREIIAYDTKEEAAERIRYYADHPEEAAAIARAGQARTLRDHSYARRMSELAPILEAYLAKGARR